MTPKQKTDAPDHLRPETARWFTEVCKTFDLESHHRRLLRLAAESWDRGQQAREILDREGLIFEDRFGSPKARPEISIERDSRIGFARLVRELGLDHSEIEPPRGPTIKGKGI